MQYNTQASGSIEHSISELIFIEGMVHLPQK